MRDGRRVDVRPGHVDIRGLLDDGRGGAVNIGTADTPRGLWVLARLGRTLPWVFHNIKIKNIGATTHNLKQAWWDLRRWQLLCTGR